MRFGYLNGMLRFLEIRTRDHELLAASIHGSMNDVFKIVFMTLGAVIFTAIYGIGEIDTDLWVVVSDLEEQESGTRTNIDILQLRWRCHGGEALEGFWGE